MVNNVQIQLKKLNANAIIPTYGTQGSAGADLYACIENSVTIAPTQTIMIGTGVSIAIPEGLVGLVYARSGLSCKNGLAPANKVGVIDSDYRGEIKVALYNHSSNPYTINNGDRIAQIVFTPYFLANFEEVMNLSQTIRGEGGFGSTNK